MSKDYFVAVCDEHVLYGKKNNMKYDGESRFFGRKFVDSPQKALLNILTIDDKFRKVEIENIIKNIQFNPETKEYSYNEYRTKDFNFPKKCQMDRFEAGEYEFFLRKCSIQILKTEIENENILHLMNDEIKKVRWKK